MNRNIKTGGAVVLAGALFAAGGMGTATAAKLINGSRIAPDTITSEQLADNSVGRAELQNGLAKDGKDGAVGPQGPAGPAGSSGAEGSRGAIGETGATGATGATGSAGPAGPAGSAGIAGPRGATGSIGPVGPAGADGAAGADATYVGEHWGIIDRNVIGDGDSYLRSGPFAPVGAGAVGVPFGIGSLGIRTGTTTSKAAFGNELDIHGELPTQVSYWVYTTGENNASGSATFGNMPSVSFEIDPNLTSTPSNYSTLVYVPGNSASNKWSLIDATADTDNHWALTGAAGAATGCSTLGAYCTWEHIMDVLDDGDETAKVQTAQITKGRDYAFSGAVDGLSIDGATYDFEPFGVTEGR